MKKTISHLIKEIIPIIVGILVALFINNWNEDRKDKEYLSQILSSLDRELKETSIDITENIAKQQILIDTLEYYTTNQKVSILDIMKKANGISIPKIRINSW